MTKYKVLITGGKGFLGSRLILKLKKQYDHIHLFNKDISTIADINERYDLVIHLAAINKPKENNLMSLISTNVLGTNAVMEYCKKNNAKCILASSSSVYKPSEVPTLLHENCEIGPTSYYGLSKYLSESTCKYYADNFGLSVAVLRIFNMYGPNQNKSFLIPDLIDQINTTKEINLRTPFVVRDFVHVDDVAQAFISMCNFVYNGCVIMNVGTGIGLSPFEIIRCLDINANINTQKIENRKIDYVIADVTRINQLISWKAKISVQKGLKDILKNINAQ